jgi:hypothetical protein
MKYANHHEVARILGIKDGEVASLILRGIIPAKRVGKRSFVVPLDSLREYVAPKPTRVRGRLTGKALGWNMSRIVMDAQKRAKKKKIPFDLIDHDVRELFIMSMGKCTLTGIPFRRPEGEKIRYRKNPYAPSIDRIDNALGYTRANVRLVCVAINLAMHQWGLEFFDELISARQKFRKKWNQ